jgi:hypothetical protein
MPTKVLINEKAFAQKLQAIIDKNWNRNLTSKYLLNLARYNALKEGLEFIKQTMIKQFLNHPVTREIKTAYLTGTSDNLSRTLGNYGNLYSFIGFSSLDGDPTKEIQTLLEEINVSVLSRKRDIFVNIEMPSKEQIWAVTPLPWAAGRSWAQGIESGISGLGSYISLEYQHPKSRSGYGFQTGSKKYKSNLRGRLSKNTSARKSNRFIPVPYISDLLTTYEKEFKNYFKLFYKSNQSILISRLQSES